MLSGIQTHLNAKLVRCDAEHRFELADEVERRDLHFAREVCDRWGELALLSQQLARQAETPEPFVSEQHVSP